MTRKPNFAKFLLGVFVLGLLFIGTFAYTHAPRSTAANLAPAVAAKLTTSTGTTAAPVVPVPTPVTHVSVVNNSAFELEGNITLDTGTRDDWINLNCPGTTPTPKAEVSTGVVPYDGKNYTQGGSKDIYDINANTTANTNWLWTQSSVPDKNLISNAYAAEYSLPDSNGNPDTLLYVGGDRFTNNGDAFIGVWFFQSPVFTVPDSPGTFRSGPTTADPLAQHVFGDILILADFTQGGTAASPKVFKWVAPCTNDTTAFPPAVAGNCPIAGRTSKGVVISNCQKGGTLCDITPPAGADPVVNQGFSNGSLNTIPTACQSTWQFTSKTGTPTGTIDINEFFEVGINLTALGLGGECFPTFDVETRSSQSVDAQLKAFVLHSFENCGVSCVKTVAETAVCFGTDVHYTYEVDNPFPVAVTATVRDDEGTPSSPDPTVPGSDDVYISGMGPPDINGVFPACTVTTSSVSFAVPAGTGAGQLGCIRTVSNLPVTTGRTNTSHTVATTPGGTVLPECTQTATVIVNPNPTANAGPDQTANCVTAATTAFTLAGSSSNGTHLWSCNDTAANCAKVSITTPGALNSGVVFTGTGSVQLRLTTTSDSTPSCGTATDDMSLTVTPAVGVSINHQTTCDLSGATTLTLQATTSGGTGPITFQWSGGSSSTADHISAGPGTYTITVTDANGCTAQATRKVGLCSD